MSIKDTGETFCGSAPMHFYTVPQLAALIGVADMTVRRWIKAGRIEAINYGVRSTRIPAQVVAKFLDHGPKNEAANDG